MKRPDPPRPKPVPSALDLILLANVTVSAFVAIVLAFLQDWAPATYFMAQAVFFHLMVNGRNP